MPLKRITPLSFHHLFTVWLLSSSWHAQQWDECHERWFSSNISRVFLKLNFQTIIIWISVNYTTTVYFDEIFIMSSSNMRLRQYVLQNVCVSDRDHFPSGHQGTGKICFLLFETHGPWEWDCLLWTWRIAVLRNNEHSICMGKPEW